MAKKSLYPEYNVLKEKDHWDPHTREIVLKRLKPPQELLFFSDEEDKIIRDIIKHLMYDNREKLIDFIIFHLDRTFYKGKEAQRKEKIPPVNSLVKIGLKKLNLAAEELYNKTFLSLDVKEQFAIISQLQHGKLPLNDWPVNLQKAFFEKLLSEITGAYYSHPEVWSEIGYGGPAYPRGYIRVELGLTDPWEAKKGGNRNNS